MPVKSIYRAAAIFAALFLFIAMIIYIKSNINKISTTVYPSYTYVISDNYGYAVFGEDVQIAKNQRPPEYKLAISYSDNCDVNTFCQRNFIAHLSNGKCILGFYKNADDKALISFAKETWGQKLLSIDTLDTNNCYFYVDTQTFLKEKDNKNILYVK